MAKLCVKCGIPIYGKSRKYCPECKKLVHLNQMNDYYTKHTERWQYNGLYWDQQSAGKCGTGSLGAKALDDPEKEYKQIQKELKNLGLRTKNEYWRA